MMRPATRERLRYLVWAWVLLGTLVTYALLVWTLVLTYRQLNVRDVIDAERDVKLNKAVCQVLSSVAERAPGSMVPLAIQFDCAPFELGGK